MKKVLTSLIVLFLFCGLSSEAAKNKKDYTLQKDFNVQKQKEAIETDKRVQELLDSDVSSSKRYKKITDDDRIISALELMEGTIGSFSHRAILGTNLSHKPMKITFKNLGEINESYANFDALGWFQNRRLNIYINEKHQDAPPAALAALLSHEALHQDEFDSLNEETYAWTMEAAVWTQLTDENPNLENSTHPLVTRENTLKKLFEKGNYTNKYLKKSVFSNTSYKNLPTRSPGFEDDL